jgi:hypothetical protein
MPASASLNVVSVNVVNLLSAAQLFRRVTAFCRTAALSDSRVFYRKRHVFSRTLEFSDSRILGFYQRPQASTSQALLHQLTASQAPNVFSTAKQFVTIPKGFESAAPQRVAAFLALSTL